MTERIAKCVVEKIDGTNFMSGEEAHKFMAYKTDKGAITFIRKLLEEITLFKKFAQSARNGGVGIISGVYSNVDMEAKEVALQNCISILEGSM